MSASHGLFTIGHGVLPFDTFAGNLLSHGVRTVVDVRTHPSSSRAPQYDHTVLNAALRNLGMTYKWAGETLGGRPDDALRTDSGAPDYERMAQEPRTQGALNKLVDLSRIEVVALLCSETMPLECHRSRMLEPELEKRGVQVDHILRDGSVLGTPTLFG